MCSHVLYMLTAAYRRIYTPSISTLYIININKPTPQYTVVYQAVLAHAV